MAKESDSENEEKRLNSMYILKVEPRGCAGEHIKGLEKGGWGVLKFKTII